MKDEIKEILDSLKIQCDEVKMCMFDEFKVDYIIKLLDYITNLQEEVNKLTAESTEWEERTYCWQDTSSNLQIKIDKAIEYIKKSMNNPQPFYEYLFGDENGKVENLNKLLNILNGDDEVE